jgi:hypothetical protein
VVEEEMEMEGGEEEVVAHLPGVVGLTAGAARER